MACYSFLSLIRFIEFRFGKKRTEKIEERAGGVLSLSLENEERGRKERKKEELRKRNEVERNRKKLVSTTSSWSKKVHFLFSLSHFSVLFSTENTYGVKRSVKNYEFY